MKKTQSILAFLLLFSTASLSQFVDTDFNPPIAGVPEVYAHEVQSDGKILLSGNFVVFENQPVGSIIRVNEDGTLDEGFEITEDIGNTIIDRIEEISEDYILVCSRNQGGSWVLNNDGSLKTNLDEAIKNQTNYDITVGAFVLNQESILVKTHGKFYKISINGGIDPVFDSPLLTENEQIRGISIQNDAKIIVVGQKNGNDPNQLPVGFVYRYNSDGSFDDSFLTGKTNYLSIQNVEIDDQGRIYVVGLFDKYNNITSPNGITRLSSDGRHDASFKLTNIEDMPDLSANDIIVIDDASLVISGASPALNAQVIFKTDLNGERIDSYHTTQLSTIGGYQTHLQKHSNGISASGSFQKVNGNEKYAFVKIKNNGTVIEEFKLAAHSLASISDVILQSDGKIIVGGKFVNIDGTEEGETNKNLIRLNSDGSLDNFDSPFENQNRIESLVQQKDGKYLISGEFRSIGKEGLVRLNNNGTIDETFEVTYFGQESIVKLSSENQIIVGGGFNSVNGKMISGLAKIDLNGNVVETFNTNNLLPENYNVRAIDSLHDGSILVGGFYGPTLTGFLWKLDKNASEIEFKLKELPYYSVGNIKVLEDRILVSGATNNPPCPVFQIDFDGNIIDQTSLSLTYPDPVIFDFQLLELDQVLIGGRFDKINNLTHVGLARASLTGEVDENFTLDIEGYRAYIGNIVPIDLNSAYITGRFKGINGIRLNGIAKINFQAVRPPKIVSQINVPEIAEDESIYIPLETLEISRNFDPDIEKASTNSSYNNKLFSLNILDGDNYEFNDHQITPELNFNGEIKINITVTDDDLESDQFSYLINISAVNDPPLIVEQVEIPTFFKGEHFQITKDIFTIHDPDDELLEIEILEGSDYTVSNNTIIVDKGYSKNSVNLNVIATDGELNSEIYITTILLENPPILSINTSNLLSQVKIYPIPCTDHITLDYTRLLTRNKITIQDLSGKIVYTKELDGDHSNTTINTSKFQKGIYFLTLRHGGQSFTRKIIKN